MGTFNKTWLLVAAEQREFSGISRRFGGLRKLSWHARFAAEAWWGGDRWWMIANGPGPRLVAQALEKKIDVDGIVSTGFCGALDPALQVGDIVRGVVSGDRVLVTAAEKRELRARTGAAAVDMESETVAKKAGEWGIPFFCVRAVSDTAGEDMPLDFNLYRDREGRFSRARIALAGFTAAPALLRLDRNCRIAARSLGDFFADNRF